MKFDHLSYILILIVTVHSFTSRAHTNFSKQKVISQMITPMNLCQAAIQVTHYALPILPDNTADLKNLNINIIKNRKFISDIFNFSTNIRIIAHETNEMGKSPILLHFIEELTIAIKALQTFLYSNSSKLAYSPDLSTRTLEVANEIVLISALIGRESCPPHTALGIGYFTSEPHVP